MKRLLILYGIIFFLVFCLFFPVEFTAGASYGLLLWYRALLPVLLPFFLLTGLIRGMGFTDRLNRLFAPITVRFLHLPASYGSILFFGLISGLPISAGMINNLPKEDKKINLLYPLLLASHVSPGFITGYLATYILASPHLSPLLFLTIYGGNILAAIVFLRPRTRFSVNLLHSINEVPNYSTTSTSQIRDTESPRQSFSTLFSETIHNSVLSIVTVGVNVMLFSVAVALCRTLFRVPTFFLPSLRPVFECLTLILSGLFEVTSGCGALLTTPVPTFARLSLVVFFASFGGLSGIFQIRSVLKAPFSVGHFIKIKISTALLSTTAMLILQFLFSIK